MKQKTFLIFNTLLFTTLLLLTEYWVVHFKFQNRFNYINSRLLLNFVNLYGFFFDYYDNNFSVIKGNLFMTFNSKVHTTFENFQTPNFDENSFTN